MAFRRLIIRFSSAQLLGTLQGSVGGVLRFHLDGADAGRSTLHLSDLRLPLAEIAPVWMSVGEAQLDSLCHDVDDPHVGDLTEGAQVGVRDCGGGIRHVEEPRDPELGRNGKAGNR
jgi:hypothetical protein